MATDFTVNKADLEFILKQIKIAEATSPGVHRQRPSRSVQAIMNEYGIDRRQCGDRAVRPAHGRWHQSTVWSPARAISARRTRCSRG